MNYKKKYKNLCVFLDAGHGGIDPNGEYTTNGKMFKHDKSIHDFHGDGWFYEGVSNRNITYKVSEKLNELGINNVIVSHPYQDTPLRHRSSLANNLSRGFYSSLFISNHSNASRSHLAKGFEIYSSKGKTKSDYFANIYWQNMKNKIGSNIHYRPSGDINYKNKEANFSVLVNTVMPAVLTEHLFFDNPKDAILLINEDFTDLIADVQVKSIIDYFDWLIFS